MIINLTATLYETERKGDVKRMRHEGKIPAILYGHKEKSRRIFIEQREFKKVLEVLRREAVTINLKIGEKEFLCVIKAIQHNPVTGNLLHIDFQHIHKKEKIKATIPIHIIGTAPGIEKGGILDHHLHGVVVKCLPTDMPSHIEVDVSQLDLGQTIHLYDVELPNTEFDMTQETPVVSVLVPRAVVAEAKPVVEEGEEEKVEGEAKEEGKEEAKEAAEGKEPKGKGKETDKSTKKE